MGGSEKVAERYRRAAAELPTAVAPSLSGSAVDGYWLDADRYFFVTDAEVAGFGCLPLPFLASRSAAEARPVLEPPLLVSLLRGLDPSLRTADIGAALYGWREPGRLVVQVKGHLLTVDPAGPTIISTQPAQTRAELLSPSGRMALFVDGQDLSISEPGGAVRRLTTDGAADRAYGQQPQSSLSTLAYRRRPHPVAQWSPDESWVLTHRVDERHVPERALVESSPPGGGAPVAHRFRYASARDALPTVTLVAFHLPTGRRVDLSPEELALFPALVSRWVWFVDNSRICHLKSDRYQRVLRLVLIDLTTGVERLLFEEKTDSGYLEPHPVLGAPPNIRYLPDTDEVLWWSERDGWGHLYLADAASGQIQRQLTSGKWQVRDLIDVDTAERTVLFTAGGLASEDPILRSLARVPLDGGSPVVLVCGDFARGEAAVRSEPVAAPTDVLRPSGRKTSVSPHLDAVVVRRSAPLGETATEIVDLQGGQGFAIAKASSQNPAPAPIWLDVQAADGTTNLKAALFRPRDHDGVERLPIVDLAYPGPQSLLLARTSGGRVAQQAQALAELGLAVMVTDSRGLPFRSRDFHQQGYGDLLEPQMQDHAAVIDQLCHRFHFLDRTRVGILGSSAGGAAAVHALLAYPEVFHVGIALCGPYDPADYLCGWMLKYVGPDVDGRWDGQALGRRAGQLRGRLLLMHGELDDNVHPSHTMRLAAALIEARKPFDIRLVPGEGHMLQLTSPFVQQSIWNYFLTHLRGEQPPSGFVLRYGPDELSVLARVNGREALWL